MSGLSRFLTSVCGLAALAAGLSAVDTRDTKMLTLPALGPDRVAFVYANDLWTAGLDGGPARRLTADAGAESNPVFSPDGAWIAFTGQYDGNTDVFIIPAEGGVPRRLTWHPGADVVQSFSPDGRAVIFTSTRSSAVRAYSRLFSVPMDGGFPEALELPNASRAALSPDGRFIAYNPFQEAFGQWKNYRGGRNSRLWIYDRTDRSVTKVPQPEGRANDVEPMWLGGKLLFRSDRNGEFNLFSYDPGSGQAAQLTKFADFPILSAATDGRRVVFERAGALHIYDPEAKRVRPLAIGVAADLPELRPRYASGLRYARNAALSPTGARAAVEFRGEIVTVPAEKGDPRNITGSPGVHERSPAWSPDGRSIAYFSDVSGEYELHVRPQDGRGQARAYELGGAGFYDSPVWSPDGRKIAFLDNSWSLYWIDLESGGVRKVGSEYLYGPARTLAASWSPDSRWIAYTLSTATYIQKVYIHSVAENVSRPVTDGLSDVGEPVFDAGGKYLLFFASTDSGPVRQWFDMSNTGLQATRSLYLAVLRRDLPNPLAKESDEEKPKEEKAQGGAPAGKTPPPAKNAAAAPPEVRIDFDGLEYRIVDLPIPAGNYMNLAAGEAGKIYYQDFRSAGFGPSGGDIHLYDLEKRKDEVLVTGASAFTLSADGKKMLTVGRDAWSIVPAGVKPPPGQGRLNLDAVSVPIDPRVEWRQIFDEAWRINRDYFYDPNFHGCDWPAMKAKYAPFLDHLACREDLNRLIQWMCSELGVGHHRVGGGDSPGRPNRVPGGLLGADYEIANGRYRFAKVYGGLNWNPELRSPLTEPGVGARAGEYLLAVDGRDLTPPENLFARFENTAGKIVELTVGPNPDGTGARTVKAVPVADESALRNRDWVEGNLKKVHEATNGRVAYVYVPNTSTLGYVYFRRYFYPQADKEAIIVDERFNGGGSVADYYIDMLRRPLVCYWAMRYGADLKTPSASIDGPKVMLINETAGSGGDLLPWMWRKFGLGPLVGTRTWGGLVGTLGFPVLMDGGSVTAPNLAIWTEDGFIVENEGVPPDIEVEQTPKDVMDGRDPQLEKAIQIIMDRLEADPPRQPHKPAYPIRVRK